MLSASKMELLSVVVLKEKAEEVTLRLLKLGLFHPVDIRHIEQNIKGLSSFEVDKEYSQWNAFQARSGEIARKLNIKLSIEKEIKEMTPGDVESKLADIDSKAQPVLSQKEELKEELSTQETLFSQLKTYPLFSLKRESAYSFLDVSLGKMEEKNMEAMERSLKNMPHVLYPFKKEAGKIVALFIGLRRDRVFTEKVLKDLFWEKIDYPEELGNFSKEVEEKMAAQISDYKKRLSGIDTEIKSLGEYSRRDLSLIQAFVMLKKSMLEAKKFSCVTEKTVFISGWIPGDQRDKVISEIKKIENVSYTESIRPEDAHVLKEDVPVRFEHGPFLKPFEFLVDSYGIPRYGTIDPTIFVAISFLTMFGAMFGDIGHGIVLAIAGLLLQKNVNQKVRQASMLGVYCGASSLIFGILYGSFFGIEFHSLWLKPMEDIMGIFKISIIFGIIMISVGILLNVINALKDKDYLKAIFDKAGLIGGVIYWAAIGLISKAFISNQKASILYLWLFALGIALLFLKPFIEAYVKKEKSENILVAFIESLVDILEIGMSYLANTISFIRIAAFSLAHVGLFLAIFELSKIIEQSSLKYFSFLVVIVGNILIIGLEGLVVSIQSLRLNYYEFFSKFFVSGKNVYKPIKIE